MERGDVRAVNMLPPGLEQRMGTRFMNRREQAERDALMECPPVPPALLEHLKIMFSDPDKTAKPTNPLLGQLLIVQYGVRKVIQYLEAQYNMQSAIARKERGV